MSTMMTPKEFKAMLKEIHGRIIDNLLQCGMDMEIISSETEAVLRVLPLENHPLREFVDVLAGGLMPVKVEMVIPDGTNADPQVVYNCLTIMEKTSSVMLDTFFTMAHRAYQEDGEAWKKARELNPGAHGALEMMFTARNRRGRSDDPGEMVARIIALLAKKCERNPEDMMAEALDGLKASVGNLVNPPKSTN